MIYVIFFLVFCYYLLSSWNDKPKHQEISDTQVDNHSFGYGNLPRGGRYRNNYMNSMYYYSEEEYERFRAYRDHRINVLGRWFFAGLMMAMIIFILL